jgi:hypothetical protein
LVTVVALSRERRRRAPTDVTGGENFTAYAFPDLPFEDALRLAASRVRHDRLVEAQEAFLQGAAERWCEVVRLRAFLNALEERCSGEGLTPEITSWLSWGHAHCNRLDPLSAPAIEELRTYAASLRSPPDLPPRHPEEADWQDAGLLDEFLDAEA